MPGEGTCTHDSDCYMSTYNYCGYDNCHNAAVFSAKTIYRNLISLSSSDRYQSFWLRQELKQCECPSVLCDRTKFV